jgi:hypothetical protein
MGRRLVNKAKKGHERKSLRIKCRAASVQEFSAEHQICRQNHPSLVKATTLTVANYITNFMNICDININTDTFPACLRSL